MIPCPTHATYDCRGCSGNNPHYEPTFTHPVYCTTLKKHIAREDVSKYCAAAYNSRSRPVMQQSDDELAELREKYTAMILQKPQEEEGKR